MSRYARQLSFDQAEAIRASDDSVTDAAAKHGVNRGVVSNIRNNITYKHDEEGLSYSGWPDGRIGEGCKRRERKP